MRRRHRHSPARRAVLGLFAAAVLLLQIVPASLAAPSGTVTGVLEVEGERSVDAVAVVTIVDAGAGSIEPLIVGQQRGPAQGAGPLPFVVRYDPARIDPARPYLLYASIVDGDAVLQSTAAVPVITGGPEVDVVVPMASRPDGSATLTITVTKLDETVLSDAAVVQAAVVKVGGGRLAARAISVAPGQVPVTLSIPYDPALVDPLAQYLAKAAIVDGGAVWETPVSVQVVPGSTEAAAIEVTALPTQLPTIPASPAPSTSPGVTAAPTVAPTPAPTATATPTPTAAPTAAPTATPAPSDTPAPSATPAPSITPLPVEATVSGTLVYREAATLSGAAKAVVALLDEGNASSVAVVTSQVIPTPGQQPIAFSLTFAPADLTAERAYTVRASIVDGDNAWVSEVGVPVITNGAPTSGVVVPLTYRPDLLLGEVTGTLTGIDETLSDGASSVTMVVQPETGAVLGFDARPQPGATAPIPFSVPFNVAEVDADVTYVVTSEVTDGDRSWEATSAPPVITNGNPFSGVVVPLAAVATPTPTPSPTATPVPTPAATLDPGAGTGDDEGGTPWWLLLVALIVIGGIGGFLYMRRGATPPPTGTPPASPA